MRKKILIPLGVLILMAALGAGAFYGGTLYEQSRATSVRNAFFADRGGGAAPVGTPGAPGAFGGGGGGIVGEVKSLDGDTLTISTPQDVTTVRLTETTTISKQAAAERGELKIGDTVTVRGIADASGAITAASIQVMGQAAGAAVP